LNHQCGKRLALALLKCSLAHSSPLIKKTFPFWHLLKIPPPTAHYLSLPAKHLNAAFWLQKNCFFLQFFPLLLLCFFITFFLFTPLLTIRSLYNYHERQMQGNPLLLAILSIFVLPWLTFAFFIIAPFFLRWSDGMATDIDFLAAGLKGHT
jgi:hypothetical protein